MVSFFDTIYYSIYGCSMVLIFVSFFCSFKYLLCLNLLAIAVVLFIMTVFKDILF